MPRSKSKGNKHSKHRLGDMEPLLYVPPQAFDFEGFTETETVQYKDSTVSHNGKPGSSLVKTTKITAFTCINLRGETTADSSRQIDKGHKNFQNSRMEILRAANGSAFPECDKLTINLMTETIKKSSEGDYQRKWKTFLDYVHSKGLNFEDIDKGPSGKFSITSLSCKEVKTLHYLSLQISPFKTIARLL